jgi:hypothetical protein
MTEKKLIILAFLALLAVQTDRALAIALRQPIIPARIALGRRSWPGI